ncbi:MAG: rhodanese-like domain-containing protein [Chloroflexi bacterium]|nr:rhodanese-like domain-containing protein [Chloroflexota bacterium]
MPEIRDPVYPSSPGTPPGPIPEAPVLAFLRRLTAGTPSIDVDELDARLAAGSIRLIDVREDWEFKNGHVRGAIHVPAKRLPARAASLKRDRPYALICESGNRSRGATSLLLEHGFEGAVSVRGGTGAWARSGRALVR